MDSEHYLADELLDAYRCLSLGSFYLSKALPYKSASRECNSRAVPEYVIDAHEPKNESEEEMYCVRT